MADTVPDRLPVGAMPVDVPVFELDPGSGRRLRDEDNLDFAETLAQFWELKRLALQQVKL